jgi:hypothetical protein
MSLGAPDSLWFSIAFQVVSGARRFEMKALMGDLSDLDGGAVLYLEAPTIPEGMTVDEYRRTRSPRPTWARVLAAIWVKP